MSEINKSRTGGYFQSGVVLNEDEILIGFSVFLSFASIAGSVTPF